MGAGKQQRKRGRTGEKIVRAAWIAKAVDLAIQGYSTRRIGKLLGKHHGTVAKALNEEFERTRPSAEDIKRLRAVSNEQLDEQIAMWTALACAPMPDMDVDGLEPVDVARVVSASEALFRRKVESAKILVPFHKRKADLNGLDAPTKSELSGPDGGPIETSAPTMHDALIDRIDRLAAESGAGQSDPKADA